MLCFGEPGGLNIGPRDIPEIDSPERENSLWRAVTAVVTGINGVAPVMRPHCAVTANMDVTAATAVTAV